MEAHERLRLGDDVRRARSPVVTTDPDSGDLPMRCSECHQVGSHSAWCSSAAVSPSAEPAVDRAEQRLQTSQTPGGSAGADLKEGEVQSE